MRNTLLFCFLLLFSYSVNAQRVRCNTFESLQDFRAKNPRAETDAQFEYWLNQKIAARQGQRTNAYYTIPVVFHVVHNGEAVGFGSNLSAAQIQNQLNQLNADFANLSGSLYTAAASTQIQFCLATIDKNGVPMPEPGINRVDRNAMGWSAPPYSGLSSTSFIDMTIMPTTIWNPYNYFNIWTMDLSGGLLGKATFPTSSTLDGLTSGETDAHAGVFVAYQSVGSSCAPGSFGSGAGLGRTLTHEAGHFFGLRHIWGDGTCATDYCEDTPPQDQRTAGCPGVGAANNCAAAPGPKMFENYMDYTDDGCVNTFTADQVSRMQTVMLNSPRRMTLASSATCSGGAVNAIRFNYVCASVPETRVVTACPDYRDVLVNINVQSAANGAATVNFIKSGGTATDNVDYTVIPSSITFANGESTPKTIRIRIWDDGVAEPIETLTLGYTISGTGVVAGSNNQSFSLLILDNDQVPVISNVNVPFYSENFESGLNGWQGFVFGTAGPNRWTVSNTGSAGITGNAGHITNNTTTRPYFYDITGTSNSLLRSPLINGMGKFNASLSFKYICEGEVWNGQAVDYGTIMYSLDGSSFYTLKDANGSDIIFQGKSVVTAVNNLDLPAELDNTTFYLGFRWVNDNTDGINPPFLVDDIELNTTGNATEGELNHTGTKNIFSNQDVYIQSTNDNQIIARIRQASANIGCLTATVAQAGTGMVGVTTNAGSFQRTQKVITLVPSTANATVTYLASLYFSAAELAAWGVNKTNLKILQVKDGVSLNSTLTSANAKVVTPLFVNEDVANGVIEYIGNFTGFSQFMLVSPNFILPVNLMTFEAQPAKRSIGLTWKTATERNNKGFHIERSTNGADFTAIGWVKGVGSTDNASSYNFTDNFVQPNTVYYYRLKQEDFDSRVQLSVIRQAKINENSLVVTVSPNPVKDQLKIFVAGRQQPSDVSLVNVEGQTVGRWKNANLASPYTINVSRFARGHYTLVIHLAEGDVSEQVILQ